MRFKSIFAIAALGAFAVQATAADKLKVGAVFPMSGPHSTYGEESLYGMEMAMEDLKKSDPATVVTLLSSACVKLATFSPDARSKSSTTGGLPVGGRPLARLRGTVWKSAAKRLSGLTATRLPG